MYDDVGRFRRASVAESQTRSGPGCAGVNAGHAVMGSVRRQWLAFSHHTGHPGGNIHRNCNRNLGRPKPCDGLYGDCAVRERESRFLQTVCLPNSRMLVDSARVESAGIKRTSLATPHPTASHCSRSHITALGVHL